MAEASATPLLSANGASDDRLQAFPKRRASEFAHTDGALCGYLRKRGEHRRALKLRWVVLYEGHCYYYTTSEASAPKGLFSLRNYTLTTNTETLELRLERGKQDRVWVFEALAHNDLPAWSQRFRDAIKSWASQRVIDPLARSGKMRALSQYIDNDEEQSDSDASDGYDDPYDDFIRPDERGKARTATEPRLPPRQHAPPLDRFAAPQTSKDEPSALDLEALLATPLPTSRPAARLPTDTSGPPPAINRQAKPAPKAPPTSNKSHPLAQCSYFVSGMTRSQANLLVYQDGSFLVRQRDADSPLVLSVRLKSSVRHYKIFKTSAYTLGGDDARYFADPEELIQYYQHHFLPNAQFMLGTPIDMDNLATGGHVLGSVA
ncbi:uncharacterized protein MONBRDRAFT_34788 [Monosiga brevicollis MX1]|uniref:SH2 domain-containing protein n=1 Tax=Monosiga brevicollis TaxID=81824 RepID=A9VE49_MONBE|nr:uncharacterized protein MONBRDRAFT_34788 [Monosiga brevicollis MX1]EDQ84201.1 predicted protein [Monosiga brevicollis MX1]|eukprot:XP_001750989.1 hypothetical protein [Monosiga brevicollis MX1]